MQMHMMATSVAWKYSLGELNKNSFLISVNVAWNRYRYVNVDWRDAQKEK